MHKIILRYLPLFLIIVLALCFSTQLAAAAPKAQGAAPQAEDDVYSTWMDTPLVVAAPGVLENDSDAEGNPLTATLGLLPTLGVVELSSDGSFIYTPTQSITGTDTFTYTVSDAESYDTATVTLQILAFNHPPSPVDDVYTTPKNTALNVDPLSGVLTNDSDTDGDTLTVTIETTPTHGTLTFNSDGSFVYTPTQGFTGMDSFVYQVVDGNNPALLYWPFEDGADPTMDESGHGYHGSLGAGVAFTTTTPTNLPPGMAMEFDGVDDYVTVPDLGSLDSFAVSLWLNVAELPSSGLVSILHKDTYDTAGDIHMHLHTDGRLQFSVLNNTPDTFISTFAFGTNVPLNTWTHLTYVYDSIAGQFDLFVNGDEFMESETYTTAYPGILGPGQLGNWASGSRPLNGMIDDVRIYTHTLSSADAQAVMNDSAAPRAARATVRLWVQNTPPIAVADAYTTAEDIPLTVGATLGVLNNDSEPDGDAFTATVATGPAHGALALNGDGSFVYTPTQDFNGSDSFIYQIVDGNTPPPLVYWSFEDGTDPTMDESGNGYPGTLGGGVTFTTTTPITLPDSSMALSFDGVDDYVALPDLGSQDILAVSLWVNVASIGSLTSIIHSDGWGTPGQIHMHLRADGLLQFSVSSNSSTFVSTFAFGTELPLNTWTHLTYVYDSTAQHFDLIVNGGEFTESLDYTTAYPPLLGPAQLGNWSDGARPFDGMMDDLRIYNSALTVTDTQTIMRDTSISCGAWATATLTVTPEDDPPMAADDFYYTPGDTVLAIAAPGVLENDTDPDNGAVTMTLSLAPTHGDLTLAPDGSFVYTPALAFSGPDTFTYQLSDGLLSTQAVVTLMVGPLIPLAANDAYTTLQYIPLNVSAPGVLGNDEGHGDPLAARLTSAPTHGDVILASDGGFTYTPDLGYAGNDSFSYNASNGEPLLTAYWPFAEGGGSNTADITGHGYHGTLTNGPRFTTTVPVTPSFANTYALDFDGVDDYGVAPAIDLASRSFSVAFWARRDTLDTDDFVISQGSASANQGLTIGFRDDNTFTFAFYDDDADTSAVFTDTLNWHHWACTYDADTNLQTIFLDGTSIFTRTANDDYVGSGSLYIGTAFGAYFDGLLDDVRLYETALTPAQVQDAMDDNTIATTSSPATVALTVTAHPTGTLVGDVCDSATLAPLAGVDVALDSVYGASFATTTDASGQYALTVPAFAYTVTASLYGYTSTQFSGITPTPGTTTTLDIPMDKMPHYIAEGTVTDINTGWSLYASLDIDNYPGTVWTDPATGYYSVTLAAGIPYTFNVAAWTTGYLPETRAVGPLSSDLIEDFVLDVDTTDCSAPGYDATIFYDGFESGDLSAGWLVTTTNEGRVWVDTYDPYQGQYSVLLDNGVNGVYAIAGIILPIDLSSESQVALDFWWREYGDEDHDEDGVFISDDNGTTWCQVFSFSGDSASYTHTQVDLTVAAAGCGMTLSSATQILFQFYDNYSIPADGYSIDEVRLRRPCTVPTGVGLVTGHIYDDNTHAALSGAQVEAPGGYTVTSVDTPDDPNLDDGFYITYVPAGSGTFTATHPAGYGATSDSVTVLVNHTVAHDFFLPAGLLTANHETLSVTLDMGLTATLPLTLSNWGNFVADFDIVEFGEMHDATILVYTDDWIHTTPNTLVQQALRNLNLDATVYANEDYDGFLNALNVGGPWDLVIWSGENKLAPAALLDDLLAYLQSGGRLAATYWRQLDYPTHPLWTEMGFTYISNYITPPPAYWWDSGHSIFNTPQNVPEWLNRVQNSGSSQGTRLEPLANGIALAGYTTTPASNEAAIVLRDDGKALYKGLRDVSTNADDNGNGIPDGTELWMNIISYMTGSTNVDWLSETPITGTVAALDNQVVDMTFDAGAVDQPGTYYATLHIRDDTPYAALPEIPVTMTVTVPPTWGKVQGTVTRYEYCDRNPTPLADQEILIEDSNGYTATTTTDENGQYQWWLDPATSPLTLTVTYPGYTNGLKTGVLVTTGQTTTANLALRLLAPCVSLAPDHYTPALFLGERLTTTLTLTNSGALSTTFTLTEPVAMDWFTAAPVSGTLDADSDQTVEVVFDTTVLTQAGVITGTLVVTSTDPQTPSHTIPVELLVVSGTVGVAISSDSVQYGTPGTQVTHTFVVTNTGTGLGMYDLALSGETWPASAPPADTGVLDAGEAFTVVITVDIPDNPTRAPVILNSDTFTLTATARVDGTSASTTGTTHAQADVDVVLSGNQAQSGVNGDTLTYTVQITNTGSFTDTFDLTLSGSAWSPALSASDVTLGAGERTDVTVTVDIPVDAIGGDGNVIIFTATSRLTPLATRSIELASTVKAMYDFELAPVTASQSADPGADVVYTLFLTNTGNITDTFDLAGVGGSWVAQYPAQVGPLGQGAMVQMLVTVTVPFPAAVGASDSLTLAVTSQSTAATLTAMLTTLVTNIAPVADAGEAQTVAIDATVTLDGSGSYDPDGEDLTYGWTQTGGPAVSFTPNLSVTTFTAPSSDMVLTFTLTVTDVLGLASAPDEVVVTVTSSPLPVLNVFKSVDVGGQAQVPVGGVVTYTLVISNSGTGLASGVVLTDPLPSEVSFGGWVGGQPGTVTLPAPDTLDWRGDVGAGIEYTLVFTATAGAEAGGTVVNTAYYRSDGTSLQTVSDAGFTVESGYAIFLPLVMRDN